MNTIYHGDALTYLKTLPDEYVNCCITSPPYFGLRQYLPEGHPDMEKQIGLEATPAEFVRRLVDVFREVKRVLRDDGVIFVNMGDSYASGEVGRHDKLQAAGLAAGDAHPSIGRQMGEAQQERSQIRLDTGLRPKNLLGMPWRLAFALQESGWILRSDVIWCLSGGTWIYAKTQKGEMPMMIRDMARLDPKTVQLWNGDKWTQVLGHSKSQRQGTELELVLRSGERISCTPTHQFPTTRGLVQASEIQVGDVLEAACLPEPLKPIRADGIPLDVAWFLGLYLAEGSRSDDCIQIAGHIKENERLSKVQSIAAFYGGTVTHTDNGNNRNIRIHSRVLNALIDTYISGRTAKDKGLAVKCWQHTNGWLQALLDGYLSGDGHWDEMNQRWRLGFTRNYNLERDLRTLAARLGFHLTLKMSQVKMDGRVFPAFRGEIRFTRNGHHNQKKTCEVVEIRKARCRYVYDVGVVDEPHLFALASGVLTHNSKPNPMPESVSDRPTKAHEYCFLLAKSQAYWYDGDAIREITGNEMSWDEYAQKTAPGATWESGGLSLYVGAHKHDGGQAYPLGRNKRTVWTVATEPTPFAHFATFPQKLIEPMILAGCPHKVCVMCGAPWVRVIERENSDWQERKANGEVMRHGLNGAAASGAGGFKGVVIKNQSFEATCECGDETRPGIVLDPFMGSGTTALVARRLERNYLGCELNEDYLNIALERLRLPFEEHYIEPGAPKKLDDKDTKGGYTTPMWEEV